MTMRKIGAAVLSAIAVAMSDVAFAQGGDDVSLTLRRDGVVETRTVKAVAREGGMSLVIPRSELDGVDSVSVLSEFARAKVGEKGYFAFANGMVGDFTKSNGEYRLSSPPMSFWGMKTPRRTFVCEVKGMAGIL